MAEIKSVFHQNNFFRKSNRAIPDSSSYQSEMEMMAAIARGDEMAFGQLYYLYSKPAYNYILRLLYDPEIAEDILQEVFLAVWKSARGFKGNSQVKTWIFRIAHNQAVSWLRKHKQHVKIDAVTGLSMGETPEQEMMEKMKYQEVQKSLEMLSEKHRAVIELAFAFDMNYAEISEVLGCPIGTVKSRMSYALRYLSALLE